MIEEKYAGLPVGNSNIYLLSDCHISSSPQGDSAFVHTLRYIFFELATASSAKIYLDYEQNHYHQTSKY